MKSLLSRAVDNLDVSLATLGCILAIFWTIHSHAVLRNPLYTAVGITVVLPCVAYLFLRRTSPTSVRTQAEATPRTYLLTNTLFFGTLTYSIAAVHLRPELYTRPLGYFVAIALMAAVLAIEIVLLPSRRSATCLALLKIALIAVSLVWSQLFIYPSIAGVDPWWHQMFTGRILDAGHIPAGYLYSNLPGMHLLIGATSLTTGLDYKMATAFSVSLLQVVCNTLFVFLLGRYVHGPKAGLLAALLLVVANWHIRAAHWAIPNSMGVVFIPIVIYLLLKLRQETPRVSISLLVLVTVVLLFTHTIATAMLLTLLYLIWLASVVYRRLRFQRAEGARVFLVTASVLGGAGLASWALGSRHIIGELARLAERVLVEFVAAFVPSMRPPPAELSLLAAAVLHYQNTVVPLRELLFNQLGFFVFLGLALMGSFLVLSRSIRHIHGFALVTASLVFLAIDLFIVMPFHSHLPDRFHYIVQVLLAVPVGIAFVWLANLVRRKIAMACLVGTLAFALSFLMSVSPAANQDNRTFSPNTIVCYAFTKSELVAMTTAADIRDGMIGSDRNYHHLKHLPELGGRIDDISEQLFSRDFTRSQDSLVLIREETVVNPLKVLIFAPFRLDYDPQRALAEQGFSRVYDCGSVSGFVRGTSAAGA